TGVQTCALPILYLFDSKGNVVGGLYVKVSEGGDPSPDDPSSRGTGIEPPNVAGLIKSGVLTIKVHATPENTPLVKWIDREGAGLIPHWDPGDQDGSSGRKGNPVKGNTNPEGLTDKQKADLLKNINFASKSLATLGGSMFGE